MNTMINPEPQPFQTREQLLGTIDDLELLVKKLDKELDDKQKHIEELEEKLNARNITLTMADESLQSYKRQISDTKANVEALAHEHLDLEGTEFFDGIVDLFDIELTRTVTFQYTVSIEVQATIPAGMDDDEAMEELTNASLDYSFFGNGDVVIEGFDFGDMEVE